MCSLRTFVLRPQDGTRAGHALRMLTSRTFAVNHTRQRRRTPETALYAPVKRYLELLGFTVKGEVCGCDLVALRGEEPPRSTAAASSATRTT